MNKIETTNSLQSGEITTLEEDSILLCRIGDNYHAISNICSHAKVKLSEGKLRGVRITCPLHGAVFDVTTGKCLSGPASVDIDSYKVEVNDDKILIHRY